MFTVQLILFYNDKNWGVLLDNLMLPILNPTIASLESNYYYTLINYKIVDNLEVKQVSLPLLLKTKAEALAGNDYNQLEKDAISAAVGVNDLIGLLTTIPEKPVRLISKPKSIKYKEIWDYGYHIENGYFSPSGTDKDIYITDRTVGVTPKDNENNLLYLINGKVHFPVWHGNNGKILNGFKALNQMSNQSIGIIDFSELGGFKAETITEGMVDIEYSDKLQSRLLIQSSVSFYDYYLDEVEMINGELLVSGDTYFHVISGNRSYLNNVDSIISGNKSVYIDVNSVDTLLLSAEAASKIYRKQTGTVFLITHGYLHRLDEYRLTRTNQIAITLNHERIIRQASDAWSEREWLTTQSNASKNGYIVDNIDIKKYLSLGDSKLLFVKVKHMGILKERLQYGGFIDEYLHYRAPNGILYLGDGAVTNYIITDYDKDFVSIITNKMPSRNSILNTMSMLDTDTIIQGAVPGLEVKNTATMIDYYTI